MSDKVYLSAFDVGGTKTDAVLFTKDGHIVARIKDKGGNPLEFGLQNVACNYADLLKRLYSKVDDGEVAQRQGAGQFIFALVVILRINHHG